MPGALATSCLLWLINETSDNIQNGRQCGFVKLLSEFRSLGGCAEQDRFSRNPTVYVANYTFTFSSNNTLWMFPNKNMWYKAYWLVQIEFCPIRFIPSRVGGQQFKLGIWVRQILQLRKFHVRLISSFWKITNCTNRIQCFVIAAGNVECIAYTVQTVFNYCNYSTYSCILMYACSVLF